MVQKAMAAVARVKVPSDERAAFEVGQGRGPFHLAWWCSIRHRILTSRTSSPLALMIHAYGGLVWDGG
jgi:hypothetical protein